MIRRSISNFELFENIRTFDIRLSNKKVVQKDPKDPKAKKSSR